METCGIHSWPCHMTSTFSSRATWTCTRFAGSDRPAPPSPTSACTLRGRQNCSSSVTLPRATGRRSTGHLCIPASHASIRTRPACSLCVACVDSYPSSLQLVRRRRRVLEICLWHLVANRNDGHQLWWGCMDSLFDLTKVYVKNLNQRAPRAFGVKEKDQTLCKQLDMIERETESFLERMLTVAVNRRHSIGMMAMSEFCLRNKAWINSLDISRAALEFAKEHPPSDAWVVEVELALVRLTWFTFRSREVAPSFLASGGQPMVILEAIGHPCRFSLSNRSAITIFALPDLLAACWSQGHQSLVLRLLDLYLLAQGLPVLDCYPVPAVDRPSDVDRVFGPPTNKVDIVFPSSHDVMHRQVWNHFAMNGVSRDQFHLTLLGMRDFDWDETVGWFQLDSFWPELDPALLEWYLVRAPINLSLIHHLCHDLATAAVSEDVHLSPNLLLVILKWVPFDLVQAQVTRPGHRHRCDRCEQLKWMARQTGASARIKGLVDELTWHDPDKPWRQLMLFAPMEPQERVRLACDMRNLMASVPHPPPDMTWPPSSPTLSPHSSSSYTMSSSSSSSSPSSSSSIHSWASDASIPPSPSYSHSPSPPSSPSPQDQHFEAIFSAASSDQAPQRPTSWRAYLSTFFNNLGSTTRASRLVWFWPHVRDADPSTALNVIPFGDYMWALLKSHLFSDALRIWQEAVAFERFRSWRLTRADWIEVGGEQDLDDEHEARQRQAFLEFAQKHMLIDSEWGE